MVFKIIILLSCTWFFFGISRKYQGDKKQFLRKRLIQQS